MKSINPPVIRISKNKYIRYGNFMNKFNKSKINITKNDRYTTSNIDTFNNNISNKLDDCEISISLTDSKDYIWINRFIYSYNYNYMPTNIERVRSLFYDMQIHKYMHNGRFYVDGICEDIPANFKYSESIDNPLQLALFCPEIKEYIYKYRNPNTIEAIFCAADELIFD